MALLNFDMRGDTRPSPSPLGDAIGGWSIEVMPRTAAKVENFRALLPADTLVYTAHIAGTPIEDMVATARRLHDEGFAVMPHFPARAIADKAMLESLRKKGKVALPEDMDIDPSTATHDRLAARSLEELVDWSGGLYDIPERFKK